MAAGTILGILFGITNAYGYGYNFWQNYEKGQQAMDLLEAQKKRQLEINDLQFNLDKKNAFKQADDTNRATTIAEAVLGSNANQAFNTMGLRQQGNTLAYNQAAIQQGVNTGSGLQSLALSGTRQSSAGNALNMQSNLSGQQLQLQQDIDRKQDLLTLEGAVNNFAEGVENLGIRRTQAKEMKDTYSEGGDIYNLYQKKRNDYIQTVEEKKQQINRDRQWDWFSDTLNLITGGLVGAKKGYDMGVDIDKYIMKHKTPDLAKATDINTGAFSFDDLTQPNFFIG